MSQPWPDGVGRHVFARVTSTNDEALRLGPALGGPAWIMAHEQTQGRGRRGRGWTMPAGNLAATLVLRPRGGLATAAQLSFVAALALYDALALAAGPRARLAIKWPNDVLLNQGKVAGILLESAGAGQADSLVAVGIGVNLAVAPDSAQVEQGAVPPVSLLQETGHRIAPDEFLDLLAPAFAHWQHQLDTYGFPVIRNAWIARAGRIGQHVTARMGNYQEQGIFEGVDDTGALLLATETGRRAIPAADIFFAREV